MSLPGPAVVVVGSLHYDVMVAAPHRPAAGETVAGTRWHPKFGGKGGNQALAAARSGAVVRMLGAVGDDAFGSFLRDGLRRGGVDDSFVATLPSQRSGMSVAISDASGDYGAVIVSGANLEIEPAGLKASELWQSAGILMLQNEVAENLNMQAAREARARGLRVCWNAAPNRPSAFDLMGLVDLLVVNALEAEAMSGLHVTDLSGAHRAAKVLAARFPIAVVTAGGKGVVVAEGSGDGFGLPAEPIVPVSTHGAGDTFIGTLVARLARGISLQNAVREANVSAARHVAGLT